LLVELDVWNAGGLDLEAAALYTNTAAPRLRAVGFAPLATRVLPDEVLGAAAGAFHGGRTEASLVGVRFPAVHLDIAQTYVAAAQLVGLSDLVLARDWSVEEDTEPLRVWLNALAESTDPVAQLLDTDVWRRFGTTVAMARLGGAHVPYRAR